MPIDQIAPANIHHLELLSGVHLVAPVRPAVPEASDSTEEPGEPGYVVRFGRTFKRPVLDETAPLTRPRKAT
jgi:hypothetical protein